MLGPGAGSVSRRLLGRLRDVMAAGGSAQDRLNRVVRLIAADIVAEVCSCYVMRAGEVLELFATEGLLQSAVHQTRLRVGEGLVGDIAAHARPLALADAQSHPLFAYRPETGEEIYNSLVGVPILRDGRVVGVLVVQNRTQRHYTDEEIETLETVAMVLAELISSGELFNRAELVRTEGNAVLPTRLEGLSLVGGIASGVAVMHQPRIVLERLVAENPELEMTRLREALVRMRVALDEMFDAQDLAGGGAHRDVLETYRMFAEDSGWVARIGEAVRSGLTAEAAVLRVGEDTRARMSQVSDAYLRERLQDLEDLGNRLLRHLMPEGAGGPAAREELPEDAILVARNLGPTELLDYDRRRLRGLVLEEGSPTTHVTLLAHALDIPMIGQVKGALERIDPRDHLILDADNGQVFLRPSDDLSEAYAANLSARASRQAAYAAMRDLPAVTRCGVRVSLMINAGLQIDLPQLDATGADGVGLYRTEVPFMVRSQLPDLEAQTGLYSRILDAAAGRPVLFRTLDVGSDKLLPYWNSPGEDNPAMGWRSIRITLDHPALLRMQVRALIAAAAGRDLHVMFPMVAEVAELDHARSILEMELDRAAAKGESPRRVVVGTMLEVPALAWQMRALARRVDFVSIGSNDLTQFMFAIDRGNPRVAGRYDTLSPAMLNMFREVARACRETGVTLSVCGDMAGRPLEAMALLGLGIRILSMPAPSIGPVKALVRSLSLPELEEFLADKFDRPDHSLRETLRAYAKDHGIAVAG